jgi:hypothetical protein
VFIAKRGSGKSTCVKDIMCHKKYLPVGIVCSGTEDGNGFYKNFIPDSLIYNEFRLDAIESVVNSQRLLVNQGKKSPAFIILDDCMYDKKFLRETVIRQIFYNGRHWNMFFLLTMQYVMDLTPDLRSNIDYVFVFRENILQNREKIYKQFFGIFPTFDMFNQVMNKCTENYECLVLDNTSKSNKIEDCVFWYKARNMDNVQFRICHPDVWRKHNNKYNPKHDEKQFETIKKRLESKKKDNVVNPKKPVYMVEKKEQEKTKGPMDSCKDFHSKQVSRYSI